MSTSKSERTRERILQCALELFSQKSFDQVSVRAVAKCAQVDPALIHHYFGSKEKLFDAMLTSTLEPGQIEEQVIAAPRERWGQEMVRAAEQAWTSPAGPGLLAAARRAIGGNSELMQRFLTRSLLSRIARNIDAPSEERELRASLVASQMSGLLLARHVLRIEPLASLSTAQVVELIGPTIQHYLSGELNA